MKVNNGHNPLCVIAPRHRVVVVDGSLTDFGGGIDMKVKLLEREGVDLSRLYRRSATRPSILLVGTEVWL